MTNDANSRVRYFPGQFLRTSDFTEEQRYHLAMRRRHNIGHHTFGILTGLDITLQDGRPVVEPGMAVDGYGRELVLVQRTPIDAPRAFTARGTDRLQVWLAYNLVAAGAAPEGYASCREGDDTSYRVVEQPLLRYTVPDPDETDRRHPGTVPDGDRDFGPTRTPPDDPIDDWPVFLGSVTRRREGGQDTYTIDSDDRPYAGLVGEEIRAPSGRASVQVGAEHDDDPFRFAVRIADVDLPDADVPLAVLREGGVKVVGETTLLGNVEVGGVVEINAATTEVNLSSVDAQPWTLSRIADTDSHNELRLQMDGQLGAADHEVVIGAWTTVTQSDGSQKEKFSPCLTIGSDCTVIVHGDLVVEGSLVGANRRPLQLSESADAAAHAAFQGGMGITTGIIGSLFWQQPAGSDVSSTQQARSAPLDDPALVAAHLASDPDLLAEIATKLREQHEQAAEHLRSALDEQE